jgi:hypothetical protein
MHNSRTEMLATGNIQVKSHTFIDKNHTRLSIYSKRLKPGLF